MNDLIVQGLEISLISIVVLFVTMGVLVLIIYLLNLIVIREPARPAPDQLPPATSRERTGDKDQRVAAAIAAALIHLRSLDTAQSGLGNSLQSEPGPWWMAGQLGSTHAPGVAPGKEE